MSDDEPKLSKYEKEKVKRENDLKYNEAYVKRKTRNQQNLRRQK